MARPVTLFTGQWADLTLEVICEKAKQWGYDGIELPCWGDHFNVQKALERSGLLQGTSRSARQVRTEDLGDLESPDRPVGAGSQRLPDRRLGARRDPGRRQEEDGMGDPGDEGHGAGRAEAGRQGGQRLHRLVDLASALLLPAGFGRHHRGRLQAVRRALESDPGRLQGMRGQVRAWRSIRPRSPSTSIPPRRPSRPSPTVPSSVSTSTRATSSGSSWTPWNSSGRSPSGSTTCT